MSTANEHEYGTPRDYYCPECDWRETRHWQPPYPHCPECGHSMTRRDPFVYPADYELGSLGLPTFRRHSRKFPLEVNVE